MGEEIPDPSPQDPPDPHPDPGRHAVGLRGVLAQRPGRQGKEIEQENPGCGPDTSSDPGKPGSSLPSVSSAGADSWARATPETTSADCTSSGKPPNA